MARPDLVRRGQARQARQGMMRHGKAECGLARQAKAGKAGLDAARDGEARQGRHDLARRGDTGQDKAGKAWIGTTGRSTARHDKPNEEEIMTNVEITKELQAIAKSAPGGVLHPSEVIDFAKKNKSSALNKQFNWDVAEAAQEHWLWQARRIINTHYVVVKNRGDGKAVEMRSFVVAPQTDGGGERGYVATERAISRPESRERVLNDILDRLRSIIKSYPMPELDLISKAIDNADPRL